MFTLVSVPPGPAQPPTTSSGPSSVPIFLVHSSEPPWSVSGQGRDSVLLRVSKTDQLTRAQAWKVVTAELTL